MVAEATIWGNTVYLQLAIVVNSGDVHEKTKIFIWFISCYFIIIIGFFIDGEIVVQGATTEKLYVEDELHSLTITDSLTPKSIYSFSLQLVAPTLDFLLGDTREEVKLESDAAVLECRTKPGALTGKLCTL